jgi:hypothetical protein
MGWEQVGARRYFYLSRRVGGRPRRVYVGPANSPAAELAAAAAGMRRLGQEAAARERQAEQARHQEVEAPLLALCARTDVLTRAALLSAGFHRHHRGPWRRRRREPGTTG